MFDNNTLEEDRQLDELPAGTTLLLGQYEIERYLVRGGFGITYLAHDSLERQYVIKECFPGALCGRSGGEVHPLTAEWGEQYKAILSHFLSEARRVARLSHPNIVQVHQVFEENNTAYMAMSVVNGEDLLSIVDNEPERLTPQVVTNAMRDALKAIEYIHDLGILHRDISPDNLLLDDHNNLTLIDFGAAREHAGRDNRALSAMLAVKDGYSPHEFYLTDVEQTAASDFYSLGATFYHLITGSAPPNSQDRLAALAADQSDPYQPLVGGEWDFDRNFLCAIDRALAVLPKDRIRSAQDWLDMISEDAREAETDEGPAPVVEGELKFAISRLVETTNKNVQQGMPGYAKKLAEQRIKNRRQRATDYGDKAKPAQTVDIFGNPVENVDAWMREQERALRSQPKMVRRDDSPKKGQKAADVDDKRPANRSTFGRLLAACLPNRREPASSALQN